jgi:hypothetical protein
MSAVAAGSDWIAAASSAFAEPALPAEDPPALAAAASDADAQMEPASASDGDEQKEGAAAEDPVTVTRARERKQMWRAEQLAAWDLNWKAAKMKARQLRRAAQGASHVAEGAAAFASSEMAQAADGGDFEIESGTPTYALPPSHYPLSATEEAAFDARWIPFWLKHDRKKAADGGAGAAAAASESESDEEPLQRPRWKADMTEDEWKKHHAADECYWEHRANVRLLAAVASAEEERKRRENAPQRDRPDRRPAAAAASKRLQAQAAEEVRQNT